MSQEHEHSDVLVPHSRSDMKRVGLVILSAGLVLFVPAWRFFLFGANDQEIHAGYAFAVGGALLVGVGATIAARAWRR